MPGVPLFDWMVRKRAMGSIHTILLLLPSSVKTSEIRKQAFDLKSVSIKQIVCSVHYGE